MTSSSKPCRRPEIPWRVIEGEALIVSPRAGLVFPLNPVAARCWELADGTHAVSEIIAVISDEFDAPRERIERDVLQFIKELVEKDLLELRDADVTSESSGEVMHGRV